MIWWIVSAAAVVSLLAHLGSKNAVWGTATFGAIIGVVLGLFHGFEWSTVGKAFVIGALVGVGFEWLPRLVSGPRRSDLPPG